MCGGGSKSDGGAAQARAEEEARQARIKQGMEGIDTTFSRFDDPYYSSINRSYLDYASPQLEEQYRKAQEELAYALARGGVTDSTIAGKKQADLQRQYDLNRAAIVDEAANQEKTARSAVSGERSNLVSQLQSTADPTAAANAAATAAQTLSMRPSFSPLTQLFTNVTAGLAASQPTYSDGSGVIERLRASNLFGTGTATGSTAAGSSRVVS